MLPSLQYYGFIIDSLLKKVRKFTALDFSQVKWFYAYRWKSVASIWQVGKFVYEYKWMCQVYLWEKTTHAISGTCLSMLSLSYHAAYFLLKKRLPWKLNLKLCKLYEISLLELRFRRCCGVSSQKRYSRDRKDLQVKIDWRLMVETAVDLYTLGNVILSKTYSN